LNVLLFEMHKERIEKEKEAARRENRPELVVRMFITRSELEDEVARDRYRPRRYDHPTIGEIAAIFELDANGQVPKNICVIVFLKISKLLFLF
jgi:hypothetical protein